MGIGNFIAKKVILPLTFLTVAATALLNPVQAQNRAMLGDTIWGQGVFLTTNIEDDNSVSDVLLSLTPENMAMITPDTTYQITTDNSGWADFNLPVYIDSTTGIEDLIKNEPKVLPNFGSETNIHFNKIEKGVIEVYNMAGQLVARDDFNTKHEYLQLDNLAVGMYAYNIVTESGIQLGGKFMKQNTPLKGPTAPPSDLSSNFKESNSYDATYWAKWEKEGFVTDSTLITLTDGNNGFINFFMTPVAGLPNSHDIAGTFVNGDDNYSTVSGAIVNLEDLTSGDFFSTTTDANGDYIFHDLPLNHDLSMEFGGLDDFYSYTNNTYTTPNQVQNASDTINDHFDIILKYKLVNASAQMIKDHTRNGSQQTEYKFHIKTEGSNSFTSSQANTLRAEIAQIQADENNVRTYAESSVALVGEGINFTKGAYTTNAYSEEITTPIGTTLLPIKRAETSLEVGIPVKTTHEVKQAVAFDQVTDATSVMYTNPTNYSQSDKDVGIFETEYWNGVYQLSMSWVDLNKIAEGLDNKSNQSNSSGLDIEFDYISK